MDPILGPHTVESSQTPNGGHRSNCGRYDQASPMCPGAPGARRGCAPFVRSRRACTLAVRHRLLGESGRHVIVDRMRRAGWTHFQRYCSGIPILLRVKILMRTSIPHVTLSTYQLRPQPRRVQQRPVPPTTEGHGPLWQWSPLPCPPLLRVEATHLLPARPKTGLLQLGALPAVPARDGERNQRRLTIWPNRSWRGTCGASCQVGLSNYPGELNATNLVSGCEHWPSRRQDVTGADQRSSICCERPKGKTTCTSVAGTATGT